MNTASAPSLAFVRPSPASQPRGLRVEQPATSREAAYRRLATAILRLDVESLAGDLRAQRLELSISRAA